MYLLDTCVMSELMKPKPSPAESQGHVLPTLDAFIAATAIAKDLILATRNEKHVWGSSAETLNPWIL